MHLSSDRVFIRPGGVSVETGCRESHADGEGDSGRNGLDQRPHHDRCQRRSKTARFAPLRGLTGVFGGDHLLVFVFEPVGVAFEDEDFGVVDEPVDHGSDRDGVPEDL